MSAAIPTEEMERRLNVLERRLTDTIEVVSENEDRLRALEGTRRVGPVQTRRAPSPPRVVEPVQKPRPSGSNGHAWDPRPAPDPGFRIPRDPTALGDSLGGRALAWLGGVATLLGIVLLLGLAISHGWIGPAARVALAAAGSSVLMAGGIWLHARRGRTEAAIAMVGSATAGWFATVVVAGEVYGLIPPLAAVAAAMVVGALATALAIRWAGVAIAVVGLLGALLSPLMVGAPADLVTMAVLAVGAVCAMWLVCWRRWAWLALATVLICAPQWARWLAAGQRPLLAAAGLATFGSIGLVGGVVAQLRSADEDRALGAAGALVLLNALMIGAAGRWLFGAPGGGAWLAGLALVHAGIGLQRRPRLAIPDTLRRLPISVGVIAADLALASALHGLTLTAVWGASAIGFAVLVRRTAPGARDEAWLGVALGAHIGLVLFRALLDLTPGQLTSGPELVPLASTAILATTCLGAARLNGGRQAWRTLLDSLGLLAIGFITAATLQGAALVGAWALEAVALAQVAKRSGDPVARYGGLVLLAGSAAHTLALEAPASGLVGGVDSLTAATLAMAATAAATLITGLLSDRRELIRPALLAAPGVAVLYLASLAIITAFQPAAGTESVIVLDLGVRQQGQVLLSALWGAVGVSALVAGLRRNLAVLRNGALALLMATVGKVFLYDLSTLTSIYRVVSFLVLGALLLAGAFAYQRLRPPPLPDMRAMHRSQR